MSMLRFSCVFFFKQKTAYEIHSSLEFRRVLFRSTYVQEGLGKHKGFEYARTQNPTRTALEKNMAVLEAGCAGYAFASGMAAITALTQLLLKQDDHAVCTENVYGGTFRLFDTIVKNYGVEFTYVDTSNLGDLERAIRPNTRMDFVETPANPP